MNTTTAAPPKQFKISPSSAFAIDDEPVQFIRAGGAAPAEPRDSEAKPFLPARAPEPRASVEPPPLPAQARVPAPSSPASEPAPEAATPATPAVAPEPFRQLALRAIFGVDRELSADELLERARSLAGVRLLARVSGDDAQLVESARRVLDHIGNEPARLVCGGRPVEFVREGEVVFAVQTENGFAPGVRETLILVARELARL